MAAATIASSLFHAAGDMYFATYNLTSVADTNTLTALGFGVIDNIIVTTKTSGTPVYGGATWSGNVITFDMSATGSLTVTVIGR
jgi:hypothetical protein